MHFYPLWSIFCLELFGQPAPTVAAACLLLVLGSSSLDSCCRDELEQRWRRSQAAASEPTVAYLEARSGLWLARGSDRLSVFFLLMCLVLNQRMFLFIIHVLFTQPLITNLGVLRASQPKEEV